MFGEHLRIRKKYHGLVYILSLRRILFLFRLSIKICRRIKESNTSLYIWEIVMAKAKMSPKWKNRIEGSLRTFAIQGFFAFVFFVGTLLDPLIGVWMGLFYFFIVGTFSIYFCQINQLEKHRNEK
jgi:hypothetical protein